MRHWSIYRNIKNDENRQKIEDDKRRENYMKKVIRTHNNSLEGLTNSSDQTYPIGSAPLEAVEELVVTR